MPDEKLIFPTEYVPREQASAAHKKWEQANPNGDAPKWRTFRDKVLAYEAGDVVSIPDMATPHGDALVAAGKLHMSVVDLGAVWDPPPPPDPPPSGPFIDTFQELDAVFLPTWTSSSQIQEGVTNPAGLGGGVYNVSNSGNTGIRFVSTSQMPAPWSSSLKVCFAQLGIRHAIGGLDTFRFKFMLPSSHNPSGIMNSWQAGTLFEFGHTSSSSGHFIGIDGRTAAGAYGMHLALAKSPWQSDPGSFDWYPFLPVGQIQLDHFYEVEAQFRYRSDSQGYAKVIVDGQTIVNQNRATHPGGGEIPLCQPGWYSVRGSVMSAVDIYNLEYSYA